MWYIISYLNYLPQITFFFILHHFTNLTITKPFFPFLLIFIVLMGN